MPAPRPNGPSLRLPLVQPRLRAGCRTPTRGSVRQFIRYRLGAGRRLRRWSSPAPTACRAPFPTTFLPVEDQGYFFVVVQVPDGASLERTDAVAKKVRDILEATPGVEIAGFISGLNFLTNAAQSNSAVEFAILKPWDERGPEENASTPRRRRCAPSCSPFRKPSR